MAILGAYLLGRMHSAQKQIVDAAVKQAANASTATAARDEIATTLAAEVKATNAMDDQALLDSLNADFADVELRSGKKPPSPK